jgi:hypothetical protein
MTYAQEKEVRDKIIETACPKVELFDEEDRKRFEPIMAFFKAKL